MIRETDRASQRKKIIADVMAEHDISAEEFFSKRRSEEMVSARRDATLRLHAAGFSVRRIAVILQRDRSTIEYYKTGTRRAVKRQTTRAWRLLYMLPNEDRETIENLAAEKNVSPYHLTLKWLMERAQSEQSARHAA